MASATGARRAGSRRESPTPRPSSAAVSASALRHRPVVVMVWRESSGTGGLTLCNSEHRFRGDSG
jgi:hypothetical protein